MQSNLQKQTHKIQRVGGACSAGPESAIVLKYDFTI